MSNSHVDVAARAGFAGLLGALLITGCVFAPASDAPAPALEEKPPPVTTPGQPVERIRLVRAELESVETDAPEVRQIVHPDDLASLEDPVLVTARVARPFVFLQRTASPVVVLNGQPLPRSIVTGERNDVVMAVVASRRTLQRTNRVQVGWLGDLEDTLSEPLEAALPR